jgi:2-C-methyl-D-erythritol 4-phosphate cytidylyltransferase
MNKYAIIVAGGSGSRMGSTIPKQFLLLKGKPLLWHSINAFTQAFADIEIILVIPQNFLEKGIAIAKEFPGHTIHTKAGGETRFHSVKEGLSLVKKEAVILVHDGVRCLVTPQLIINCFEAAVEKGNAVPAIPATDSIRLIRGTDNKPVDRNDIRLMQTPQAFLSRQLLPAFNQAYDASFTDEALVVENTGVTINLIAGDINNIKITRPIDLVIAETILDNLS